LEQLTGPQRRQLKGLAHDLRPLIQIGKAGATEGLVEALDKALSDHELVKVRFLEHKTERKEISRAIAEKTRSQLVGLIGNVAIFYRENKDPSKRKVSLRA
jgi:RNA-binding protein